MSTRGEEGRWGGRKANCFSGHSTAPHIGELGGGLMTVRSDQDGYTLIASSIVCSGSYIFFSITTTTTTTNNNRYRQPLAFGVYQVAPDGRLQAGDEMSMSLYRQNDGLSEENLMRQVCTTHRTGGVCLMRCCC